MRVLVTGGAGYIGSHMVATLLAAGHDVTVLDDLSTGHRDAVLPGARFVEGDIATDAAALLRDGIDAVCHFAALSRIEESVREPRRYFQGNTVKTLALLDAVLDGAAPPSFVFSSTASVYGSPDVVPIDEGQPKRPESPYGTTKLAIGHAI